MRQMRKKIIIAILVTLLLTAGVAFAINHFIVKAKNEEIAELQALVVDTKCLAFANDLKADSIITQSDLKVVDIKMTSLSAGTYMVTDETINVQKTDENGACFEEEETIIKHMILKDGTLEESQAKADYNLTELDLVGRVVKSNVSANTVVMDSLLYNKNDEPNKDERIQEFNFLQLPSDLIENDYIDVRIQFPTGEDYSVLIGKKVEKYAGENTIFIKMNEEEIMAMGSAIIEAYMQDGVRLYANKYTDPATQLFNEEIVDYVAKYDYAVEKLSKEITDLGLRKAIAEKFVEDELYVKSTTGEYVLGDETVVGTVNITVHSGDVIDTLGTIATADTEVTINIVKNITEDNEEELLVSKESWILIPQLMKDEALENNPELAEIPLDDLENKILAEYAGIKEDYIEEIKLANMQNNSNVLSYYKVMKVEVRDEIIRSYPVRDEVLAVVRNNPNILEVIKAEFDTTALLNTRVDEYKKLEAEYNATIDEYAKQEIKQKMDELLSERVGNVEENLKTEIETQRAERVSYLESLINGSEEVYE